MRWLSTRSTQVKSKEPLDFEWPQVSIITAVYNEEAVLAEKFKCLEELDYPEEKLHIFFGSDKSSDRSNDMLKTFSSQRNNVTFVPFNQRQGKIGVINQLGDLAIEEFGKSEGHVFLYNDANVMLKKDTLKKLMRHFNSEKTALVDANMLSRKLQSSGISKAERAYINREVMLKHWEGEAWGTLQGAFGGCYGLRSDFFVKVPDGYLVDDFFISFHAMLKGGEAINDLSAECFESASHDIWQEYKRKSRISAGNFQNLSYIFNRWNEVRGQLKFCFISHKVLRWLVPFLLVGSLISVLALSVLGLQLYNSLFVIGLIGAVLIPLLDVVLMRVGWHFGVFRKIRYFIIMNIALLSGFFRYVKGIQNGFWEPPKRV